MIKADNTQKRCFVACDEQTKKDGRCSCLTNTHQTLQLQQSDVSSSIDALLSKFDNGLELYQNNAVFANCIEHLLRGGDIYKIFEQIIVMQQEQQKHYSEIISSGVLRQEIIVSKERFDELKSGL